MKRLGCLEVVLQNTREEETIPKKKKRLPGLYGAASDMFSFETFIETECHKAQDILKPNTNGST